MPSSTDLKSKTGNAQIRAVGQTTDGKIGSNPDMQAKGYSEPRTLTLGK